MAKKATFEDMPPESSELPFKTISSSKAYDLSSEGSTPEISHEFCVLWDFEMIGENGL